MTQVVALFGTSIGGVANIGSLYRRPMTQAESPPARIITGTPSLRRVRWVVAAPPGLPMGPNWAAWTCYQALVINGRPVGTHVIWRGTRAAAADSLPTGAVLLRREALSFGAANRTPVLHDIKDTARRLSLIDLIWDAPYPMTARDAEAAIRRVDNPPSPVVHCSIRPDQNGRWIAQTGVGRLRQDWGGYATPEEARFVAEGEVRKAWLTWHRQIIDICKGRTDWVGGVPTCRPCVVLPGVQPGSASTVHGD